MKYLYVFTAVFTAGTVGRGIVGCVVVRMYSGVSVSPGYVGHVEGIRPTPPCEPLWRLTGWG
ncbi:hypothetical protein [Muribaculum intestinale]|uniref:hypothetical protein n=1 Tax=Muribaculum intestinale TaxID=1796646 RepID=UPI00241F8C21|nr:hypothetical protein [Muribaculum intestinale]